MATNIFTALASAARTASGSSDAFEFPASFSEMTVYVDITAASGTSPTISVEYQTSPDGTRWFTHTGTAQQTAAGKATIKIAGNIGRIGRIQYWIGGTTPSFTFQVDVEGKRRD